MTDNQEYNFEALEALDTDEVTFLDVEEHESGVGCTVTLKITSDLPEDVLKRILEEAFGGDARILHVH